MSSRWKKGHSGNPKGRPRKTGPEKPDIKRLIADVLSRKVSVTTADGSQKMSLLGAGLEQLGIKLARGESRALRDMLLLADKFGVDLTGPVKAGASNSSGAAKLIADFLRRHLEDIAAKPREIAPPDLVDDDPSGEEVT